DLVHYEVVDPPILNVDEFRILPADLKDRIDVGGNLDRGTELAGDLVLDQVRAQQVRSQIPAASRDRDAQHVQPLAESIADHVESLADGLNGPAAGGQVDALVDLPVGAEKDEVRAHRSD